MPGKVHYETAERIATITLDNPGGAERLRPRDVPGAQANLGRRGGESRRRLRDRHRRWREGLLHGLGRDFARDGREPEARARRSLVGTVRPHHGAPEPLLEARHHGRQRRLQRRGLHFIADTELVIAAEDATFLDTHVAVGLASALEPAGLARRIPLERVFRLALLGKHGRMTAREALALGLVGEVVPGAPADVESARDCRASWPSTRRRRWRARSGRSGRVWTAA